MATSLAYYPGVTGTSTLALPAGWIAVTIRVATLAPQAVGSAGNPRRWYGLGRWQLEWSGGVSQVQSWTLASGPIRWRNLGLLPLSPLPTGLPLNLTPGTVCNVEVLGP